MHVIAQRRISSIASMISLLKSRGCEVVKRMRRIPGTADMPQQGGKFPTLGRRVEIAIDVLA